jgi:hypothetical protein
MIKNCLKNASFLLFIGATATWSASTFGTTALGESRTWTTGPQAGMAGAGGALIGDAAYNPNWPSQMVFSDKTAFDLSMDMQNTWVEAQGQTGRLSDFNIGHLGMAIPMSGAGALGVGYGLAYRKSFQITPEDSTLGSSDWNGSIYRFVFSYGYRLNRTISLGVTGAFYNGEDVLLRTQSLLPNSEQSSLASARISGLRSEEIFTSRYYGQMALGGGLSVVFPNWGVVLGYEHPTTLTREERLSLNLLRDSTVQSLSGIRTIQIKDSLYTTVKKSEFKTPTVLRAAMFADVSRRQTLLADVQLDLRSQTAFPYAISQKSNESVEVAEFAFNVGLGYFLWGSRNDYDAYMKKISWSAGLEYQDGYIDDMMQVKGALGTHLPIGRRGALMSFNLYGGWRTNNHDAFSISEYFSGMNITFTGIGQWGKSSRRYR